MNYCRPLTLLCIACLFFGRDTAAQQPCFEEEISPSLTAGISLVNGIAADANNCIWLSTQSGIYRYDGARFRSYSTLNTPVLKFERMECFQSVLSQNKSSWCISDAKGNMYDSDSLSHLRSLNPSQDTKIIFGLRLLMLWKQGKSFSSSIPAENILFTYYSRGRDLFYLSLRGGKMATISPARLLEGGQFSYIESSVPNDEKFQRLFTTDNGLYCFTPKGMIRIRDAATPIEPISLEGDIVFAGKQLNYDSIRIFPTAGNSSVLIWYRGNIYELSESVPKNTMNTRLLAKGSPVDLPSFLYHSPTHHLLIGCFLNKGLILYRPRQFSLLTYNGADRRTDNYYYALLPSGNGYLTVNTTGIIWLGIDGSSKVLYQGNFSIYYLFRDKAGNTWYQKGAQDLKGGGVQPGHIGYLEAGTNRPVKIYEPGLHNSLAGIYQPDDSTFYILTNHSFDKLIYTREKTRVESLFAFPAGTEYTILYPRKPGTLWIGNDRGLLEFEIAGKTLKTVEELANSNVRAITKLAENDFLIGTYDKWIYHNKNDQWLRLTPADKMVAPSAHALIIDSFSNSIWVSSNKGIARLSLHQVKEMNMNGNGEIYTEHFTGFGKDISVEFNGSSNVSGGRLSDSNTAFANASGLVVFNPRLLLTPPLPGKVLVEPVYDNDPISQKDSENHQVRFSVSVPYFGNRGNLEVLYKMTNTDDDWHRLYPNAIISYNNLGPGDHDLQFRIRHYTDSKGEEVFIIANSFYIPYRWYQEPWFRVVAALLLLALIVVLHNVRIWYLRKRKKELEKIVQTKTSELEDTNRKLSETVDDLRVSEADLKQSNYLKDEYYAVLTHDLRSPLKFLSFNISQLLDLLPEMDSEKLKKGLVVAYECTNDVHKLVDEFVYWIQNNENLLVPRAIPVNISAVAADIKKIYGFSFEGNKNELVTDISPDLRFITDQQMFFIILRNAIDNANKYTTGGTITVSAERQDGNLKVKVSDTGTGIKEEMVEQLTDLQYQNVQLGYKKRRSLGFYIMAMLTKKLNGSYTISSERGKGTGIHFIIPEAKED